MNGTAERLAETVHAEERDAQARVPVGGRAKRLVDLTVSLVALVAIWPLFVMIVVIMKLTDPGPVFFAHGRGQAPADAEAVLLAAIDSFHAQGAHGR